MKLEFMYLAFFIFMYSLYYVLQRKFVINGYVHSSTLIRGMNINLVFNIFSTLSSIVCFLVVDAVSTGLNVRYGNEIFKFLLHTQNITSHALLVMNICASIGAVVTAVVAFNLSLKRKGHKNLKLEKTLTSDCAVCIVCSALSLVEFVLSVLLYH